MKGLSAETQREIMAGGAMAVLRPPLIQSAWAIAGQALCTESSRPRPLC